MLEGIALLGLGFVVGLSGALLPGPLLIYTINESLERGKWTGALVIAGHAAVEVVIFLLLMLGLTEMITSQLFIRAVSLAGGIMLVLMGIQSARGLGSRVEFKPKKAGYGAVMGGVIFTLFNPGFPVWWVTVGMRLLLEGMQRMGFLGMFLVFLGHWGADLGWFLFVSMATTKSSGLLFEKGWYRKVRVLLSAVLMAIGAYFLSTGI